MKIALISCTSRKKSYKCQAKDLYSESSRFQLAFSFAKLIADKIFILSAKYGLIPENMIIEPYNETLKDKSTQERRAWAEMVLNELRKVSDLEHDEFIVLAGEVYHENLLPHMNHFWLPLKGKRRGISSSLAHLISQSCPSAFLVFLVTIINTPSHPFIFVRHFVFHAESQGSLTDISMNSKGLLLFFACPTKKSRKFASSIAKLINILLLISNSFQI
jgi:hypothetical protein